jgi:hypothetical protein
MVLVQNTWFIYNLNRVLVINNIHSDYYYYIQLVSFINSITPIYTQIQVTIYIYTWRIPLALISPCQFPFLPLCTLFYLLGTLLAVTGIVHLGLRLLVN